MIYTTTRFFQYFLGTLFVVSALLKINDPLGLQYKIDEYFDVFQLFSLKTFSFEMAVLMNVLEFMLGVGILLNIYMNLFRWLTLGIILFFTFLTGFAFLSGTLKECGCLGNCIPLTAGISFLKDIILLIVSFYLVFSFRKMYKPLRFSLSRNLFWLLAILAYLMQVYAYVFLPVWDCMPFEIGKHIPTEIKSYITNTKGTIDMRFVYEKDGQEVQFPADSFPPNFDSSYHFIRRDDYITASTAANDGGIADFTLTDLTTKEDVSNLILHQEEVILVLILNDLGWKRIEEQITRNPSILFGEKTCYIVSSITEKMITLFDKYNLPREKGILVDNVTLKTMARSPLTVYYLHKGTIVDKQGTTFYSTLY